MADKSLSWLREIEIEDLLDKDVKLIHDHCGMDVLIAMLVNFPSMGLYISTRPLTEAKKRYIKKYHNGANTKDLCRLLDVSERFVYDVLENGNSLPGQDPLFQFPE